MAWPDKDHREGVRRSADTDIRIPRAQGWTVVLLGIGYAVTSATFAVSWGAGKEKVDTTQSLEIAIMQRDDRQFRTELLSDIAKYREGVRAELARRPTIEDMQSRLFAQQRELSVRTTDVVTRDQLALRDQRMEQLGTTLEELREVLELIRSDLSMLRQQMGPHPPPRSRAGEHGAAHCDLAPRARGAGPRAATASAHAQPTVRMSCAANPRVRSSGG